MRIEDTWVSNLRYRCHRQSSSACKTLYLYEAISELLRRLGTLVDLDDLLKPRPPEPPQPDPSPFLGGRLGDLLAGDPETDPAKFFPVASPEWDKTRRSLQLEVAQALRDALEKLTAELDENIEVLKQTAAK